MKKMIFSILLAALAVFSVQAFADNPNDTLILQKIDASVAVASPFAFTLPAATTNSMWYLLLPKQNATLAIDIVSRVGVDMLIGQANSVHTNGTALTNYNFNLSLTNKTGAFKVYSAPIAIQTNVWKASEHVYNTDRPFMYRMLLQSGKNYVVKIQNSFTGLTNVQAVRGRFIMMLR